MTISEQSYEVEYGTPRSSLSMYDTPFYVTARLSSRARTRAQPQLICPPIPA